MQLNFSPLKSRVSLYVFFDALKASTKRYTIGFWTIIIVSFLLAGIAVVLTVVPNVPDSNGANYVLFLFSIATLSSLVGFYTKVRTTIRLKRFAETNDLQFIHESFGRDYAAMLFAGGLSRVVNGLRTPNQLFYEFGNFTLLQNERYELGYIRIMLPKELPNILLQAKRGVIISENLYPEQQLSLEGDFDKYFTLYAPNGYERDALYLFAPDIMMRFIETLGEFSCEIARDELTIFSLQPFKMTDQKQIMLILETAKIMTDKIDRQFGRYSDDRLQAAIPTRNVAISNSSRIATGGQRLKSISLTTQIVFIVFGNLFSLALIIGAIYYSTRVDEGFAATLRTIASVGVAGLVTSIVGTIKYIVNYQKR